jgi:hypothetical protein
VFKKIVGYSLLTLFVVAGTGAAYMYFRKPSSRPAQSIKVAMTKERIERGRYMFQLSDCRGCHTPHELRGGTLIALTDREASGQTFTENGNTRGIPNITPDPETGIGKWTDGEKIRAIREGIARDGQALFPMMPYEHFRYMADEDVESLVAYLNSLEPVQNRVPRTELPLFLKVMIKGAPRPVEGKVTAPPRSDRRLYGEYLVNIGLCEACHTPGDGPKVDATKRLAGGHAFNINGKTVVSANITPDQTTGIGTWSADYFKARFHRYKDGVPEDAKGKFTLMPWHNLAQLPDDDLEAIYGYLMMQPPVENKVERFPTETKMAKN